MKKTLYITLLFWSFTALFVHNASAQKKFLQASEVSALFVDSTMNVSSVNRGSQKGSPLNYRAYSSEMGSFLVIYESGSRKTWSWSINEDGAFCIRKNLGRHTSGLTCGYIYSEGNGVYKMYKAKHAYRLGKTMVEGKHIELLASFSNFKKGNRLNK